MLRERLNADRLSPCRQAHGRNGTYCGFLYTAEAERIIAKVAAMGDEARLFMYFAAHNVHAPWQAPYAPVPHPCSVLASTMLAMLQEHAC